MKITRRQLESFLREAISDLDPRQDRFDSFESLRSYVTDLITRGVGHYKNSKYGKKPDIDELNNIIYCNSLCFFLQKHIPGT